VSVKDVVEALLVVGGVAAVLVSCLGLAVGRDAYDRLHFLSAGGTVGPILVAAGIVLEAGLDGLKAILVAAIFLVTGPVLTHAIARAARLAEERSRGAGGQR
jgi:multicomponent Na+:H+ antiporter subunit G